MAKKLLLIAGNYWPELTGIGKYNGEMIDWLSDHGYNCTVLATYPYYPQWKVKDEYKKGSRWFSKEKKTTANGSVTIIRCPHYVPGNPGGFKRLLSDFTIFFSLGIAMMPQLFKKKNNYVMTVAPPFLLGLLAVFYKSIRGAAFLYHIQDLQIEAARDLKMIKSPFIINVLFAIERAILKKADVVSSISKNMIKTAEAKAGRPVAFFPNWVDVDVFFPMGNKEELKGMFAFKASDTVILYSGSIGEKQGLEHILYAARHFEKAGNVQFAICGAGPYMQNLRNMVKETGLNNVHFFPLQPAEKFNSFLNMADLHLVLQKSNAGDLVLPSKLSTILSVGGVPVVSAIKGTSLFDIVNEIDAGYLIKPEDQTSLIDALHAAIYSADTKKGANGRQYAIEFLSIHSILKTFANAHLDNCLLASHQNCSTEKLLVPDSLIKSSNIKSLPD